MYNAVVTKTSDARLWWELYGSDVVHGIYLAGILVFTGIAKYYSSWEVVVTGLAFGFGFPLLFYKKMVASKRQPLAPAGIISPDYDRLLARHPELEGRTDDEMDLALEEALTLLEPADQEYLDQPHVSVFFVHDDQVLNTKNAEPGTGFVVNALARVAMPGLSPAEPRVEISLYSFNMRHSPELCETHEKRADWVRRLLLHEIGHIRDHRSDHEMAETSKY